MRSSAILKPTVAAAPDEADRHAWTRARIASPCGCRFDVLDLDDLPKELDLLDRS